MRNSGKIFLATLVSLLIFFGGVTRFHHHLDGAEICFCSGALSGHTCHHSHHDDECCHNNASSQNHDSSAEDNCPLHLDIFIISDTQHIDIPALCCHHHHCDLCSPLAYSDEPIAQTFTFNKLDDTQPLDSGYTFALSRRGPPAC